jgi:hypothetical protein
MASHRRRWVVGVIVGSVMCGGPVLGLLGTIFGLLHSFGAVSQPSVHPAMKSTMLASGISSSMWFTAIGLGMLPVGVLVLGISIWRLIAARSALPAGDASVTAPDRQTAREG